ncbi:MAG: response regulator transcription factor [Planctomycetaceae bacterium]|nr:response regulator transcription factor [Planctomycetaceae bacterium]
MTTRVLIADDHAMLRAGLKMLIETQSDLAVVGEVGDFQSISERLAALAPDVLLMDLTMPGGNGVKWIERICKDHPQVRLLVLTMHDDPAYFRLALAAGAAGYMVKSAADSELLNAIRTVAAGRVYAQLQFERRMDSDPFLKLPADPNRTPLETLSSREREVLDLLAIGHTNQEIADKLYLSVKTVESYRARLMTKLGLKTRAELTQFAMNLGILNVEPREQE